MASGLLSDGFAQSAQDSVPSPLQSPASQVPSSMAGKSLGSIRHWQPVFSTDSIALISARKSCFGGRPLPRTAGKGFTTYGAKTAHGSSVKSVGYIASSLSAVDVPHLSASVIIS